MLLPHLVVAVLLTAVPPQEQVRSEALASGYQEAFVNVAGPAAREIHAGYDIPASTTVAQAILESNWGRSGLSANDRNFFGFKCVAADRPGPIASGCHAYDSTECTPDCHPVTAYFRVYPAMSDSFRDYGRLLTSSGLYDHALPFRHDPKAFITAVAHPYATDPAYAAKVIALMDRYDLYKWDS